MSNGILLRHRREVHPKNRVFYCCLVEGCGNVYRRRSNCKDHFDRKHSDVVWSDVMIKEVSEVDVGKDYDVSKKRVRKRKVGDGG